MKEIINKLVEKSVEKFVNLVDKRGHFNLALNAYDFFCKEEKDGVDYIFDLENQDDLIEFIKASFSYMDIFSIVKHEGRYVMINSDKTYRLLTKEEVRNQIKCFSYELMKSVIEFPSFSQYTKIYEKIITFELIE